MRFVCETEDAPVDVIPPHLVPAHAKAQIFVSAELIRRWAESDSRWDAQRNLMRPATVDCARRQFAPAAAHWRALPDQELNDGRFCSRFVSRVNISS
jgi:hypothetical protein